MRVALALLLTLASCRTVSGPDPCRDHWLCATFGMCTTDGPRCVAALDSSCAASRECADRRACRAFDGQCRPAPPCSGDYDWCKQEGRCQVVAGMCAAVTEADCAASVRCELFGECAPLRGSCVRPAETDADCRSQAGTASYSPCATNGQCTARGGRCVAENDAGCRASEVCRLAGLCGAWGGLCIATSAADCAASTDCEQDGACTLDGGACVATPEDCAALERCKQGEPCRVEGGICAPPAPFIYFQF